MITCKNINYFAASFIRNKGYDTRQSLALFLPKNSVSMGIIDEVPFQKEDLDFIVESSPDIDYVIETKQMSQDDELVIPVKNVNISPTFRSLTNDLESFDVLGVKQEEELQQGEIDLLADQDTNETTAYDYLFDPSSIINSDLLEEELSPEEIDLLDGEDVDETTVLDYLFDLPQPKNNVVRSIDYPSNDVESNIDRIDNEDINEEPSIDLVADDENMYNFIHIQEPDYDLLRKLIGPESGFSSREAYIHTMANLVRELYPEYVEAVKTGKLSIHNRY